MVSNGFFLQTLSKISKHDMVKENDMSGRINLTMIFDFVHQSEERNVRKGVGRKGDNRASCSPAECDLNAVVTASSTPTWGRRETFFERAEYGQGSYFSIERAVWLP